LHMATDVLATEHLSELTPRLETLFLPGIIGGGSSFSLINLGLGLLGQGIGANNGVNFGSFDFGGGGDEHSEPIG
jgi:hypothetical protein